MANMRVWTIRDIPTPADAAEYLARIQAVRNVFPGLPGLPEVPPDMEHFTYQEANDIEQILSMIDGAISRIPVDRVYAGEFTAGGI